MLAFTTQKTSLHQGNCEMHPRTPGHSSAAVFPPSYILAMRNRICPCFPVSALHRTARRALRRTTTPCRPSKRKSSQMAQYHHILATTKHIGTSCLASGRHITSKIAFVKDETMVTRREARRNQEGDIKLFSARLFVFLCVFAV